MQPYLLCGVLKTHKSVTEKKTEIKMNKQTKTLKTLSDPSQNLFTLFSFPGKSISLHLAPSFGSMFSGEINYSKLFKNS